MWCVYTMKTSINYNNETIYITLEDRCYYLTYKQQGLAIQVPDIGGWGDSDLNVFKITFENGGVIFDVTNVSNEYL